MLEIHGNTEGIRESVLQVMQTLYDYPIEKDEYIPQEMINYIAQVSAQINREISVYLSREGDVLDITVGGTDSVPLQDWHMRRSAHRLSRVRCVHTHPGGNPNLSNVDISALKSLMLDSMAAIGVDPEGKITGIQAAFLSTMENGTRNVTLVGPAPFRRVNQAALMEEILESEQIVDHERVDENDADTSEKALLVSIDSERSLDELAALAESAGAVVVGRVLQKKTKPDTATYIGSGKADRLQLDAQALDADVVIVDDELTGVQTRNLEQIIGVKVVDRTTLILDIFAQRAKSGEGKLQVALAQMKYRSSRLIGQGLILSRLGGGIGTRGPGESKLEIDRRRIRERITELRRELDQMEKQRELRRKSRERNQIPVVALVGYTNTGKSTLLNRITDAGVYAENRLFATLDAVSRKVTPADGGEFLLTDTVGFISKLPHDLVEAFKSTLEEAVRADVLVIVSDANDPETEQQHRVVEEVLESLGAVSQPRIEVMNKCDLERLTPVIPGEICISAKNGTGIDPLLCAITRQLRSREREYIILVPFDKYALQGELHKRGRVTNEEYTDNGTRITVSMEIEHAGYIASKYGTAVFLNGYEAPETPEY